MTDDGHLIPVIGPNGELDEIDTTTLDGKGEALALALVDTAARNNIDDLDIHLTIWTPLRDPHLTHPDRIRIITTALHTLTAAIHHDIHNTEQP